MNKKSFEDLVMCSTGKIPESVVLAGEYDRQVSIDVPTRHRAIVYLIEERKQTAREFVETLCREFDLELERKDPIHLGRRIKIPWLYSSHRNGNGLGSIDISGYVSYEELYKMAAKSLSGQEAVIARPGQPLKIIKLPEFKE